MKNILVMKRIGIIFCATIIILFNSCKEQKPPGLELEVGVKAEDSVYLASVETPQQKKVVIEEITGVTCTNCPDGARQLKTIIQQNNNNAYFVAIHGTGFAKPYLESKYDFRTEDGTEIISTLGQPGLPAAAIDRIPNAQNVFYRAKSDWNGLVTDRVNNVPTPVNLYLDGSYDVSNNEYELTTKVAFTQDITDKLNMTIYVLEDGLKDYQLDNSVKIPDYQHDHVFRDCITNIAGVPLDLADKKAGTVMQKRIKFNPKINEGVNSWNLENCSILVYITNPETKEILHAAEIKMR